MSLSAIKPILYATAPAALMAGLLLTAVQQAEILPLIRKAEGFEAGGHGQAPLSAATLVANVVIAAAFALILAAGMSLRFKSGWRQGLLWGAAGYAVFFFAPSLGLPSELPGTESAPLLARQIWWVGTVSASAAGLALVVFSRRAALRLLGVALLALPHLIGVPQPASPGVVPAELARDFLRATHVANAALWLCLGALVGLFRRRLSDQAG